MRSIPLLLAGDGPDRALMHALAAQLLSSRAADVRFVPDRIVEVAPELTVEHDLKLIGDDIAKASEFVEFKTEPKEPWRPRPPASGKQTPALPRLMKPKVNPNAGKAPEVFDSALRYWVYSRTANRKYLVELDAYDFNSCCNCKDFATRLEPLLRRGVTPAQAVATGLIVLKERQRPEDALRCYHCVDAFMTFAAHAAKIVHHHTEGKYAKAV